VLEVGVPPAGLRVPGRGITDGWGALLEALVIEPSCSAERRDRNRPATPV
jgi:hypothetical protein